jgi:subtilisin family serine protease
LVRLDALPRDESLPIRVAMIDGAVARLPSLASVVRFHETRAPSPTSVEHGTAVAGILVNDGDAPRGVVPGQELLAFEVPTDHGEVDIDDLCYALSRCLDEAPHVVNLSVAVRRAPPAGLRTLDMLVDRAMRMGTLLVVASGNDGRVDCGPLLKHPWPIGVVPTDESGTPLGMANLSPSLGKFGVRCPGSAIPAPTPAGPATLQTGSSFAAPIVTGICARLRATRGANGPRVRALLQRLRLSRQLVPPMLDCSRLTPLVETGAS